MCSARGRPESRPDPMIELVLRAPAALVEPLSDALIDELGALSVAVEDADAGTAAEHALFGEPGEQLADLAWQHSTLSALFNSDSAAEAAAAALLAQAWTQTLQVQGMNPVPQQDWVRLTQSQFEAIPITPRLWIVPSWHEPPAGAELIIRLDPGLAFGTGTHATTRMCLRWMAQQAEAATAGWSRVLDYGCGSGILAIAAAKLGAAEVDAVDVDPAALLATLDNAQRNEVSLRAGTPDAARGLYPLVLANILATPLKLLAPLLAGLVQPGGRLLLAGILERQTEDLQHCYRPHIALEVLAQEEGWVLLGGRRAMGAA